MLFCPALIIKEYKHSLFSKCVEVGVGEKRVSM